MLAACPQQMAPAMQSVTAVGWPVVQAQQLWQPPLAPGAVAHHGFVPQVPPQMGVQQVAHLGVQQMGVQQVPPQMGVQQVAHLGVQQMGVQQVPPQMGFVPQMGAADGPLQALQLGFQQAPQQAPAESCLAVDLQQALQLGFRQAPQQAQQQASAESCLAVDMTEVLLALDSLYQDELRPYGRILRKRLQERAAGAGISQVNVDARGLQAACQGCSALSVKAEEGGDWSAVVRGRPDRFVNVYSPEDCYLPEMWAAADAYFRGLDDKSMVLPGGRYSCAQVLVQRRLPFLAGRSMGQVCHILQLALSQKKLLGYLQGAVVPYHRSQSMQKERLAERQRPCSSSCRSGHGLGSWDMVRAFLQDAVGGMAEGEFVPLSNIKRMFRSKFRAELSETSLGHAKLSELLQDPRVSDLCTVKLQKHGYAVFPAAKTQAARASAISLADSITPPAAAAAAAPEAPTRRARPAPLSLGTHDGQDCAEGDEITEIGSLHISVVPVAPAAPSADAGALFPPTPEGATPCWVSRAVHVGESAPAGPLPTLLGRPTAQPGSGGGAAKDSGSAARAGAAIIADCIKAVQHHQQPPGATLGGERNIWTMQLVTPSTLGHLRGSLEQKTFIHIPEPPPMPEAVAPRRLSRSLSADL